MDNSKIEKIAVDEVSSLFNKYSMNIDPNIEKGDRGISFDGSMVVFSEDSFTKKNYQNSIPVQVKGTTVKEFDTMYAKYNEFDYDTYKNFQLEDGVVVFLVQILKSNPRVTKIFYKFLSSDEIEKILIEIKGKGNKTKTLQLQEITDELDLDKTFFDIAIIRKAYGYGVTKYDTLLKGTPRYSEKISRFETAVTEELVKTISRFEYMNSGSEYNKLLSRQLHAGLKSHFVVDTKTLAIVNRKLLLIDSLDLLPDSNRNLAFLSQAKYHSELLEFRKANEMLKKVNDINLEFKELYQAVKLSIDLGLMTLTEFKDQLGASDISDDDKLKFEALYYIRNSDYISFAQFDSKVLGTDVEWLFLRAQYLMHTNKLLEASESFAKVHKEYPLLEVAFFELYCRSLELMHKKFNNLDYIVEIDVVAQLLDEIETMRNRIFEEDKIEMIALEKLHFEMVFFSDPERGLFEIEELITTGATKYNRQYLIETKLRCLLLMSKYEEVKIFISSLQPQEISEHVISLKIIAMKGQEEYQDVVNYIDSILVDETIHKNDEVLQMLGQSFLSALFKLEPNDDAFEARAEELTNKIDLDFDNLLLLEEIRSRIKSTKYGESVEKIHYELLNGIDTKRFEALGHFFAVNPDLELIMMVEQAMRKVDDYKTDEILSIVALKHNDIATAERAICRYKNNELSEIMLSVKAEFFNRQKQFRATIQLYEETKIQHIDFLNKVLIAKINLEDKEGTKDIANYLLNANEATYHINAAFALVYFGIDMVIGIQMFLKEIISTKIKNRSLNLNFISLFLGKLHKMEYSKNINFYENSEMRWYSLRSDVRDVEYIVIPECWGIKEFEKVMVEYTSSDFQLLIEDLDQGDKVNIDDIEFEIVDTKPLSVYIFQRVLGEESGAVGSEKPLKMISIDKGIEELVAYMNQIDGSSYNGELDKIYNLYHSPFVYEKLINSEDMIWFYDAMFSTNSKYYIGSERNFDPQLQYQLSISSLMFLSSLDHLYLCTRYKNMIMEKSQQKLLQVILEKEFESKTVGRMHSYEGKLIINKSSEEEKNVRKTRLKQLVITSRKIPVTLVGEIDEEIRNLLWFDAASIESSVKNQLILFYEDEAVQKAFFEKYNLEISSVGSLISYYYLYDVVDVNSYLDLSIEILQSMNAWIITEENYRRMSYLVYISQEPDIIAKFNYWHELYSEYFTN